MTFDSSLLLPVAVIAIVLIATLWAARWVASRLDERDSNEVVWFGLSPILYAIRRLLRRDQ